MSETGHAVPDMNESLGRYNVTVTVECKGGCLSDPAALAVSPADGFPIQRLEWLALTES